MTIAPPKLLDLAARLKSQVGPFFLGIIGDKNHKYGYHLGAYEVLASDYSRQHKRDKDGISKYGGYYAAAIDIGMGWKASRAWLKWLVKECQAGKFPDVREVIGSFDGKVCFYYDNVTKKVYPRSVKDHITHSHIAFFRDAIMRSQLGVLADWRKDGRPEPPPIVVPPIELPKPPTLPNPIPAPPKVPESGQVTEPTPVEPPQKPAEPPTPQEPTTPPTPPVEPSPAPTEPPAGAPACPGVAARTGCLAGLLGAAWIIKRRNQLGAKDEGSK